METKQKTNSIIGKYSTEELNIVNYIFCKKEGNRVFTKFELNVASKVNIYDEKMIEIFKSI